MDTKTMSALGLLGLAAAFGAGWATRGALPPATPTPVATPRAAAVPPAGPVRTAAPLIAVSGDGHVTLRVEQQPLDWVLDEIARQSGLHDVRRRTVQPDAAAAPAPHGEPTPDEACPLPAEPPPSPDAARLLQAIERGSDADRLDGLLAARNDGVTLAPALLRRLWETDASDPVRLAAFEAWLEQNADRADLVRQALEAAATMPGEALPREARRRLDELAAAERPDPVDPQLQAAP